MSDRSEGMIDELVLRTAAVAEARLTGNFPPPEGSVTARYRESLAALREYIADLELKVRES